MNEAKRKPDTTATAAKMALRRETLSPAKLETNGELWPSHARSAAHVPSVGILRSQ